MLQLFREITPLDWGALAWFLACWIGYGWFADHGAHCERGLLGVSHVHRLQWARQLLRRDARIVDSSLVGNLMGSVSFYANTTIYIIAGLMAVVGTVDKAISFTAELPFARSTPRELWEIKLLLLLAVFIVAYFKFTWSIRQFNFLSILIGAAPGTDCNEEERERYARRMATINSFAGEEFNRGIRAYYFGLAALSWVIQPWVFVIITTVIVVVLYRRDYASATLKALQQRAES